MRPLGSEARGQQSYLNELGAVLKVPDDGDVQAFIPRGQRQRASRHTSPNPCVLCQCFAKVPPGFRMCGSVGPGAGRGARC